MKKAFLVIGLSNGDEGKGTIVDALAKEHGAHTVIRFNGGAQAAHNVVHDDGTHHTFNQFGSATFRGVRTHMTHHCLFDPIRLKEEAEILKTKGIKDPLSLFTVSSDALVVTPYHKFLNHIREMSRGKNAHGSCGMGIGETKEMNLRDSDLSIYAEDLYENYKNDLNDRVIAVRGYVEHELINILSSLDDEELKISLQEKIDKFMNRSLISSITEDLMIEEDNIMCALNEKRILLRDGNMIFEGAQGVLLDEWLGFHPNTTWSTTLYDNALDFLKGYTGSIIRVGVIRAYSTRHGAGPMPSYSEEMTTLLPDRENITNRWQGDFRVGALDLPLLKYAIKMAKPDVLAVTCIDRVGETFAIGSYTHNFLQRTDRENLEESESLGKMLSRNPKDMHYEEEIYPTSVLSSYVRDMTGIPVAITSYGPKADDKRYLDTKLGNLSKDHIETHQLILKTALRLR